MPEDLSQLQDRVLDKVLNAAIDCGIHSVKLTEGLIREIKRTRRDLSLLINLEPDEILNSLFTWGTTEEGAQFWGKIHRILSAPQTIKHLPYQLTLVNDVGRVVLHSDLSIRKLERYASAFPIDKGSYLLIYKQVQDKKHLVKRVVI